MRTIGTIHLTVGVIAFLVLGLPALRTGSTDGIVAGVAILVLAVASPLALVAIAGVVRRVRGAAGPPPASVSGRWERDPAAEAAAQEEGARARARERVAAPWDGHLPQ